MNQALELAAVIAEVEEPTVATSTEGERAVQLADLDRRIRELEAAIGDLRSVTAPAAIAAAAPAGGPLATGRKTLAARTPALLAKQGLGAKEHAAGIDSALGSLSIEQRIAVKSQMLRAGLL